MTLSGDTTDVAYKACGFINFMVISVATSDVLREMYDALATNLM